MNALEIQFGEECTLLDMNDEYPGNIEEIRWIIMTDLTQEQLIAKYGSILQTYVPYQLCPHEMKKVVDDFKRNENKHLQRSRRSVDITELNPDSGKFREQLSVNPFAESPARIRSSTIAREVRLALSRLTKTQQRRLTKRFLLGMKVRDIAREENRHHRAVEDAISLARQQFIAHYTRIAKRKFYYTEPDNDAMPASENDSQSK